MSLLDTILNAQGGGAVQQLGAQFGLGTADATQALSALVPALAAGVHRNVQTPDGLSGLLNALSNGGHQEYLNNPAVLGQPATATDGNSILGHIFGSKDVSRQVATQASAHTGIGADILKKMLPLAATLVMGALANRTARSTGAMGSSFNPSAGSPGGGAGDLMNVLTSTLGQGAGGIGGQSAMGGLGGLLGGLFKH